MDQKQTLEIIEALNAGEIRVAEKKAPGQWVVHAQYKQAILDTSASRR